MLPSHSIPSTHLHTIPYHTVPPSTRSTINMYVREFVSNGGNSPKCLLGTYPPHPRNRSIIYDNTRCNSFTIPRTIEHAFVLHYTVSVDSTLGSRGAQYEKLVTVNRPQFIEIIIILLPAHERETPPPSPRAQNYGVHQPTALYCTHTSE